MKDFFDLHWLSRNQIFDGTLLIKSLHATFERRATVIPANPPIALTEVFANDSGKALQWQAFRRKGKFHVPDLPEIITRLFRFLGPLLSGEAAGQTWNPESGWHEKPS